MSQSGDDVEVDQGSYNSSHRAFLQRFLAQPVMTFQDAQPVLAQILTVQESRPILPADITPPDLTTYISALNHALSPFDYEIRATYPQTASARSAATALYVLVNAQSDPATQFATALAPDEIAFVRRLLDAMFDANNTPAREVCAVREMEAVRLAKVRGEGGATQPPRTQAGEGTAAGGTQSAGASLTLDRAERVLRDLVDQGWLRKSRGGWYSLAARGLCELRGWLVEAYNDEDEEDDEEDEEGRAGDGSSRRTWQRIKTCEACREIVTVGQRCANRRCLCRLHDFCVQGVVRAQSNNNRCPLCKTTWTGNDFVGERAARGGGEE